MSRVTIPISSAGHVCLCALERANFLYRRTKEYVLDFGKYVDLWFV